ncbi:MAG: hypothetical protein ACK4ML_01985 [Alishewanella aestuarii]
MDDKSFAVLTALKKQFSEKTEPLKFTGKRKVESDTNIRIKPKAKVLSVEVPVSKVVPKQADEKSVAKKNNKHKRTNTKIKKQPKTGPKHVKATTQPPITLISDLKLTDKSLGRQVKPSNLFMANDCFKPKFDAKHSFSMPEWVGLGKLLQHPEYGERASRPIQVRIGIDFGTAFTKVAVKVGNDKFAIDWSALTGKTDTNARFLVPGIIAKTTAGEYCWHDFATNTLLTNFKLPLLTAENHSICPVSTIAYLALVIRYTRAALYRHADYGRILAQRNIRWELNIGCATEPFDNAPIVDRIRKVGLTAWFLATSNSLSDQDIETAWCQSLELDGLEAPPEVTPEFIAQIAGYLTSPQLHEGLHVLVDIGAATLDVASFNVVKNQEIDIPIFCSSVTNLGTHFLQLYRHVQLGLEPCWDDSLPIKNANTFAHEKQLSGLSVSEADKAFGQQVIQIISQVILNTKRSGKAVPNSDEWHDGLPLFITGGGAAIDLYKQAMHGVELVFRKNNPLLDRFRFIPYQSDIASNLKDKQQFDGRLTVAFGLTEDAASIARIRPPSKVHAFERRDLSLPGHEEIYPK